MPEDGDNVMRRLIAAIGGTIFATLLVAGAVAAAGPTQSPPTTKAAAGITMATVLGLTPAQVRDLRDDGLSIAQIAERQKVELDKVVAALVARWTERIDARVASGSLTKAEGDALKAKLQAEAQALVQSTTPGGMQGAAVGAGPANSNGSGSGNGDATRARDGSGAGNGACDGTGSGSGRP